MFSLKHVFYMLRIPQFKTRIESEPWKTIWNYLNLVKLRKIITAKWEMLRADKLLVEITGGEAEVRPS